tara:strand:- start:1210 stop:2079 length:870 start_codon:yes stop_codon:yes gene_type:complete
MSKFFDSNTVDHIQDLIAGNEPEVMEDPVDASPSEQQDVKEEQVESDVIEAAPVEQAAPAEEMVQNETPEDDGSVSEGTHRVPYNRFKQVIEARNQLRSEKDALAHQVAELARQMESLQGQSQQAEPVAQYQQAAPQSVEMPDFLTEEEQNYFNHLQSQFGNKYNQLEQRVQAYEVQAATQQLEYQMQQAEAKYPDVPRRAILEAVANDGSVSVMDVAERYQSFVNQLREQAISEYLESNPAPAKKAAPRPAKTGSANVSSAQPDGSKPKNLKEANKALHKFLRTNTLF